LPLYEYQCDRCGRFEVIQKFSDSPLTTCAKCGRPVQKLPSAPAIQFKGTGWYVTDYARKPSGEEAKSKEGAKDTASSSPSGDASSSQSEPAPPAKGAKTDTSKTAAGSGSGSGSKQGA